MSRKKPEWLEQNLKKLYALCEDRGYEIAELSPYHYRVLGAVAIVDVWPSRMKCNVIQIEDVEQPINVLELDPQFNKKQVLNLLETGRL